MLDYYCELQTVTHQRLIANEYLCDPTTNVALNLLRCSSPIRVAPGACALTSGSGRDIYSIDAGARFAPERKIAAANFTDAGQGPQTMRAYLLKDEARGPSDRSTGTGGGGAHGGGRSGRITKQTTGAPAESIYIDYFLKRPARFSKRKQWQQSKRRHPNGRGRARSGGACACRSKDSTQAAPVRNLAALVEPYPIPSLP
ncbi:hypothetical protein EVAR_61833_1 [Eumeta japonica]|uniref:Uncharacterized protein n=1 Tax=Eumeta variegata TaxID=151549 RepID=A0A4C1YTE2_EUMVA|nr:hypothetical protein EVAR_61833_1 [Eumeta japonica]